MELLVKSEKINIIYIKRNVECYDETLDKAISFTPPQVIRHENSGNEKGINITMVFEITSNLGKYLEIKINLDLLFSIDLLDQNLFELVLYQAQKDSILELLSRLPNDKWTDLQVVSLRQDVVQTLYEYIQMQV
jgi:hypothetical protein